MSTNRNDDQQTPTEPLPVEEQNGSANREADRESPGTSFPAPETTTSPWIKNK